MKTKMLTLICVLIVAAAGQSLSPAEISINKVQAEIAKHPNHVSYYTALAMAYARRARETSDVAYYQKAEDTLTRAFAISPDNFEARKVQAWLLLGRHEFAKALEAAAKLNKQMPDDVTVYGYLADANAELGNYSQAAEAVQWMLNLRPGNIAGLTRAGYLRELHGDLDGSIEVMQMAYDATPYSEAEDRAWLLTQIAHLYLLQGDLAKSETHANGALGLFAGYHYALGVLAQVRIAQKRYDEAVTLLRQRYEKAPHAENLFAVAEALELAGQKIEARQAFADFERKALLESSLADNANHELISYYIDYAHNPAEGLRIAKQELERRRDVFTEDCYAWALAATGEHAQAGTEIRKALAVGVKDPKILQHARMIESWLASGESSDY